MKEPLFSLMNIIHLAQSPSAQHNWEVSIRRNLIRSNISICIRNLFEQERAACGSMRATSLLPSALATLLISKCFVLTSNRIGKEVFSGSQDFTAQENLADLWFCHRSAFSLWASTLTPAFHSFREET